MTADKFFQVTAAISKALMGLLTIAVIIVLLLDMSHYMSNVGGVHYNPDKPFLDRLTTVGTVILYFAWFAFLAAMFFAVAAFVIATIVGIFSPGRRS